MSNMPFETITVEDYQNDYHDITDENTVLVDVREDDEYAAGHIPGAINIPMSELEERFGELATDKKLLLVCKTGGRSAM
ncbi:MAG: rhodanese-like domain-containing protein, partial [Aggregatilineales bacterium]